MSDNFPSDTYALWAEHEADRIAQDRRSRDTSRLCRCTQHTPKECGNLAERLPDRPLCWPCWSAQRDHRSCVIEQQTHCPDCGGTLVEIPIGVQCAACKLVMASVKPGQKPKLVLVPGVDTHAPGCLTEDGLLCVCGLEDIQNRRAEFERDALEERS